jgi:hypothetical protein
MLTSLLEKVILTSHHPRTQILVVVQVGGMVCVGGRGAAVWSGHQAPLRGVAHLIYQGSWLSRCDCCCAVQL